MVKGKLIPLAFPFKVSEITHSTGTHRHLWHLGCIYISFNYAPVTGSIIWLILLTLRTN